MNLVFSVAILLAIVICSEGCDEEGIGACEANYTAKYPESILNFSNGFTPVAINTYCTAFGKFQDCVVPYNVDGCDEVTKNFWNAEKDKHAYICTDKSKTVISNNEACIGNTIFLTSSQTCENAFTLATNSYDSGKDKSPYCTAVTTLSSCIVNVAETQCNEEVGNFFQGLIDIEANKFENVFGCIGNANGIKSSFEVTLLATLLTLMFVKSE